MLFAYLTTNAQISPALAKKLTINGTCLCKTTLPDLQQSYPDLKETPVEEMDLPANCYGQDSRFIAGKGFSTEKQLGMIFQLDQNSNEVSKIRLTKQFKGKLPDGNFVDLSQLDLKGLLKLYPSFKKDWRSRGCSNYWNFSNDTVEFYIKIDSTKKPQFPIDEAYYMDKPVEGVDLIISCYSAHKKVEAVAQEIASKDPIYFIDSVRVNQADLLRYDPNDIASVSVYKEASAIKILGPEGKSGIVYIETKQFCKHRYWTYFKSKSTAYAKLVPLPDNDANIIYILNTKVLDKNHESNLAAINDRTFKDLQIISKDQLMKEYGITDKDYGVVISSDPKAVSKDNKSKP